MATQRERVLIVDDDSDIRDLLLDQIFHPARFEVFEARDGIEGLAQVEKHKPDLIYLDLIMPGLTGKDMLVGLKARGYQGPVIVGVKRGDEQRAVEAFRFGATDYITKPIREAEMVSVVSRAMADVRLRKDRDRLMAQLKHTNEQLELQLKQLTTLQNLGQTLTAMQSLDGMFEAVLSGALDVTKADHATLILLDEQQDSLILRAGKNMTLVMQEKLGEIIRDDLARMVMTSQQPLVVEGEGLRRFKISRDILATIYAPMVVHGKAIGVLTAGNHRKRKAFDESLGPVMEALANYAAIAIVNARLFVALDQRARLAVERSQQHDQQILRTLRGLNVHLGQIARHQDLPDHLKMRLTQTVNQLGQFIQSLE